MSRRDWSMRVIAIATIGGCAHPSGEASVARPASLPELPAGQLAAPVVVPISGTGALVQPDTAREPHVDIDTHSRDEDVRPLLEFVARAGGYRLIFPTDLNRRVRVSLNNVPASVALSTLLDAADLKLESTEPGAQRPLNRAVVFYELPTNVDSLSADAIVKRFGVSPAVANMIVTSRGKP
ncbi:MAG TPA: hypothetical protein VGM82_06265 [Gemmatimonadaceae bacterium]|jgi:hypothetical protein